MEGKKNIVIELGSGYIKAGFCGEVYPSKVVRTAIGKDAAQESFFGEELKSKLSSVNLSFPISGGFIQDYDGLEKILNYVYTKKLELKPEEHTVLLVDWPTPNHDQREKLCELMFEKFKVPGFALLHKGFGGLYSTGVTTGLFFGSGDSVSYFCPMYDGRELTGNVTKFPKGGKEVTATFLKQMTENGVQLPYKKLNNAELAREIKEKMVYYPENFAEEIKNIKEDEYTLPDETVIKIKNEKIMAPETVYAEMEYAQQCKDCVLTCDMSARKELYSNIVVMGGNTQAPGFETRFKRELIEMVPEGIKKVLKVDKPKSKYVAWSGASVYADLSVFDDKAIKIAEYKDSGKNIVNIKKQS